MDQYRASVGIMVINKDQTKVLVLERAHYRNPEDAIKNPSWQMPQGGIDSGEKAVDTGFRELQEETGIKKEDLELIDFWDEFQYYKLPFINIRDGIEYVGGKQKWLVVRYLKEENSIDLNQAQDKEFKQYKWVKLNEAVKLAWAPRMEIYKSLNKRYNHLFK